MNRAVHHPAATDDGVRKQALDVRGSFIVQAPAGSGKTELLIQRLLALLAGVERPENILALTFTRKAAAEMRERVIQSLEKAATEPCPAEDHAARTHRLATRALARDREMGWSLLENPARLRIMTIDAFCMGLVRQLPLHAGLGGDLAPSDDPSMLYDAAVRMLVRDCLEGSDRLAEAFGRVLLDFDNRLEALVRMLARMLSVRDQWLRHALASAQDADAFLQAQREGLCRFIEERLAGARDALGEGRLRELAELARLAARNLGNEEGALPGRAPGCGLEDLPVWHALLAIVFTGDGKLRKPGGINKGLGFPPKSEEKERLLVLLEELADEPETVERLAEVRTLPENVHEDEFRRLKDLMELMLAAAARLQLVFAETGQCDHTEIALRALDALGGGDQPPGELLLKLDYRIQHVLVDEFQDTNEIQVRLLNRLTEGWTPGDGRTVFLVGDPMQSIYRFRKAEVGLFVRACNNEIGLPVKLRFLRLTRNFRSAPPVVAWVNDRFRSIFPPANDPVMGCVAYAESRAARSDAPGEVRLHLLERADAEAEMRRTAELIEGMQGRRIGVLVRSRSHLRGLGEMLERRGIGYRAIDVFPLEDRPVVRLLLSLVRALMHPADDLAWLALARAPIAGLDLPWLVRALEGKDDGPVGRMLLEARWPRADSVRVDLLGALDRLGSRPLGAIVDDLAGRWGLPEWFGPGSRRDIRRFLEVLESVEQAGWVDVDRLNAAIRDGYAPPPPAGEGAEVELLTMHGAKGLQWEVVILPGLGRRSGREETPPPVVYTEVSLSSGTRWLLAARDRAGGDGGLCRLVQSIEKAKDDQESRRLLYVAATRAERELHLVGHLSNDRPGKGTPLELLVDAGLGCGPAVVERVPVPEREAESLVFEPLRMRHQPDAPRPVEESEAPGAAVEFQWAGPLAAPVGTAIHAALCRIARRGVEQWHEGAFDAEVEQMRRDLIAEGLSGAMLEEALDRCREGLVRTLESERGRWILSGHHREAHAEWALAEDDAGRLARHQLDRSFIDEHGVRWIVDYKTATHEGGDLEAFLDSEEARHRPQLERYARILRRMEPGREIRAGLYFPLLDAWREVRLEPGAGGNGARG